MRPGTNVRPLTSESFKYKNQALPFEYSIKNRQYSRVWPFAQMFGGTRNSIKNVLGPADVNYLFTIRICIMPQPICLGNNKVKMVLLL